MAINVGDILASFRVIDEATEPLNQIAGAQEEVATTLKRLQGAYASAAGPIENWNKLAEQFTGMPLAERANDMASAVEAIGGAARLTQREQAQVNAVMDRGAARSIRRSASKRRRPSRIWPRRPRGPRKRIPTGSPW